MFEYGEYDVFNGQKRQSGNKAALNALERAEKRSAGYVVIARQSPCFQWLGGKNKV
jgi:hypothetical protein